MPNQICQPANLVFDLMGVLFDYQVHDDGNRQYYPLQPGLEILRECAQQLNPNGQPLHQIYILSNCSLRAYQTLLVQHPDIMALFNGKVISGEVGIKKPAPAIFQWLITQYRLNYQRTIFIDDSLENSEAGDRQGLISLHYQNPELIRQTLKILQALP